MTDINETIENYLTERITRDKTTLIFNNGDIVVQKHVEGTFKGHVTLSLGNEFRVLDDKQVAEFKKFFGMI